jgi:hypothetical protein
MAPSRHSRRQWPFDVGLPRVCEQRRRPSDVALHAPARRREEKNGTCELKNKGPLRPLLSLALRAATPQALLVAPPPHGPCSSRRRSTGVAPRTAAPRVLRIVPPPPQAMLVVLPPHVPCSSCRPPIGPAHRATGPHAQVHHTVATSPLLEEKGKVSTEKRKWRRERTGEEKVSLREEYGRR